MIRLLLIYFFFFSFVKSNELSAVDIMNNVYQAKKPKTSIMEIKLEITRKKNGREKVKTREFIRYTKLYDSGKFISKSLARFQSPKIVKGTGLLSWMYRNGKTEQWYFLPKLKKVKKIEAKEKSKTFLNTDFIYEDLESGKQNSDSLKILGTEYLEGYQCKVVMSWPKEESSYFSKKIWVNTQTWQINKVEFYKNESSMEKILYLTDFIEKEGYVTPRRMEMKRTNGNKTVMEIESFKPNVGLKEEIFSNSFLTKIK